MSDQSNEAVSNEMWRCEPCSTFHYVGTECPYKNYYAAREVAEDVSEADLCMSCPYFRMQHDFANMACPDTDEDQPTTYFRSKLKPEPTPTEISDLTAREIKAFRHLLTCSKRVYGSFMNGNHPSDRQLSDLDWAIGALEVMKICGHRAVEDCSC